MQEILASLLLVLIFAGLVLVAGYVKTLTAFFKELRHREPEIWHNIGSPTLLNMLLLPYVDFRKFYAFLPVLKERRTSDYRYARPAWFLLIGGLLYCALLLIVVVLLVIATF